VQYFGGGYNNDSLGYFLSFYETAYRSIALWGRRSGGGGGIAEAPRSVKPINICKILDDLCKK
jgi:hypothetical protein